jgi:hypothetical protein
MLTTHPALSIKILILILTIGFSNMLIVNAQSVSYFKKQLELQKLVHKKGNEQYSLGYGIVKNGWNIDAAYGKYLSKDWLFRTDFIYETVNLGLTTVNAWYVSPEFNYCIDKVSNTIYINVKAGAVVGDETAVNKIMVNKNLSQIVFGEKAGLKLEYFISTDISFNIDVEQRFINNSRIGTLTGNAYVSISYNF